ncbi:MAG TPA: porin family protein [Pyrinomonadaceae bacterium]|nr:porin family protein [Pyrinomonadaceae bacterium]
MMNKKFKHLRSLLRGLRGACAVALVCLMSVPVVATPTDMCVPSISGGLTGVPTIDGVIEGYSGPGTVNNDPGWEGVTRVNLLDNTGPNMGTLAAAKFQMGRDANFLYLGFVVGVPTPGANSHIVVGLATKAGDPATDWRFHIKPFDASTADPTFTNLNQTPNSIVWWRDSTTWNTAGAVAHVVGAGEWPLQNTRFAKSGNQYSVEMRIPIHSSAGNAGGDTAVFFPTTGTFRVYVNVLSTSVVNQMTTTQDPWPAGVIVVPGMSTFLERNTPDVTQWGTVSFNDRPECDGVTLSWNQIGVDNPAAPGNLISSIRRYDPPGAGTFTETEAQCAALAPDFQWPTLQGLPNAFVAKPFNGMVGTQAKVSATFRLANWGIPGTTEWTKLGEANPPLVPTPLNPADVTNNPAPQQTINAGATGNLVANWTLSYRWSCLYKHRPHQCIQVDLDSNDPATRFKDKSAQRNMDFVPASRFEQRARISGNQGELPPNRDEHEFLIRVETDQQGRLEGRDERTPRRLQWQELAEEAIEHFGKGVTNLGTFIARGTLKTGKTINMGGVEHEYVRRVGDFGYVAGHTGPITGWRFEFAGQELKRLSDDLYVINVKPGGEAFVNTVIETLGGDDRDDGGDKEETKNDDDGNIPADADSKRWGLSLHAGASIPHDNFNNIFNPGPNVGVDLEYRLSNHVSLEAIYTFHRFRGEDFGVVSVEDLNLHQFSGNVKAYAGSGSVRPFLNGGGGVYHFDFGGFGGDTRGGLNIGGGLQFNLTPTFAVEGLYNFHSVFTPGSNVKFSTVQGGVRFRF